jgi:hypothetical protein
MATPILGRYAENFHGRFAPLEKGQVYQVKILIVRSAQGQFARIDPCLLGKKELRSRDP